MQSLRLQKPRLFIPLRLQGTFLFKKFKRINAHPVLFHFFHRYERKALLAVGKRHIFLKPMHSNNIRVMLPVRIYARIRCLLKDALYSSGSLKMLLNGKTVYD